MIYNLQHCRIEVFSRGDEFIGLGKIWIGETQVRSGRLPLRPQFQSFHGWELSRLLLRDVTQNEGELRIQTEVAFQPMETKLMRDHSFDPMHETGDWFEAQTTKSGRLDIILRPAKDEFNGVGFNGFDYHYEYSSDDVPLFYILDKATWELDGDITGGTAYSQSACSAPVAKFDESNAWTTEGILFFLVEEADQNPVMTHNLPRWSSHGAFDFQYKDQSTLIGVFERVELIRSILRRDAGKAELKTFDKHIFDQALEYSTSPKKILLNTQPKTEVDQQNIWTWIHCETEQRARDEFGLAEGMFFPRVSLNFWNNFTTESYYKDLVPAAAAIGCKEIFVDNLKKSSMTEQTPFPGVFNWNMCCCHEFEISEKLGGNEGVRKLNDDCNKHGIRLMSWTGVEQALSSPLNDSERDARNWYVLMEDCRQKFGGAYCSVMSVLDMSQPEARDYFIKSHIKIKEETGHDVFFFDSFYNLGFMPLSYRDMKPRTMWRGMVSALKELQDAGVEMVLETFGPFGTPQHGHPSSYNLDTIFICYRVGLGNDYSTVPGSNTLYSGHPDDASATFYTLAHNAGCDMALWKNEVRIDKRWTPEHKRALADYHASMDAMKTRYLQQDGQGVLWHNEDASIAILWNFVDRDLELPGNVGNLSTGKELSPSSSYSLQAGCVYSISSVTPLPTDISSLVLQASN